MKKRKQIAGVLLSLLLGLSLIPVQAEELILNTNYSEPSSWAKETVRASELLGILPKDKGVWNFRKPITREEFSSLIALTYEKITESEITERGSFQDTSDIYVEKVAGLGIVSGMGDNKFNPKSSLTREQAASIIDRLLQKLDHPYTNNKVKLYTDTPSISNWAKRSVLQLKAEGILTGVGGNMFAPKSNYTVEQAIVTVYRTYEHHKAAVVKEEKEVLTPDYVNAQMLSLKDKYPTGTRWNNDNFYAWNGGIYSGGYGCAGFAFMLSDKAFSDLPARKHNNYDKIKVGDIIRMNNDTHSVIVIDINGTEYTLAEGNMNSAVYWGRTLTLNEIKNNANYVLTRYPI